MAKAKPCEIVFNTKWGCIFQPIRCRSVSEALGLARERKEAFRIFIRNKMVKRGWYV